MAVSHSSWLAHLPDHLAERSRIVHDGKVSSQSQFVLYWMHNALRAHENPALDVALLVSKTLDLPLLVYQGLSERYPYASDRHHAFILQGARDVHEELRSRQISSVFHLERAGHRGAHLRVLAGHAAVLVTEDMPVQPFVKWMERLAAKSQTPILGVDTSCVVPMQLVGRAHERAFVFRDATRGLRENRLSRPWVEVANPRERFSPGELPFEPTDLSNSLAHLISLCDVDHTVGPVGGTVGGSIAGYQRWNEFKQDRLPHYADDRNDALLNGVSRMSPYLHYGMVSPFRLAREASQIGGAGAEKYLDELLIWRELAYAFCFYRKDHESTNAIPSWAVQTLAEHEGDPRPNLPGWETLCRGKTGDFLWDAAQCSLLTRGELHNNVRMTWGKAMIAWTPNAATALRRLIDLNHRYALDGRDPASYGGLLWCLGQFDRPHQPSQPIFGTVRTRPTSNHANRLDPAQYLAKVTQSDESQPIRVAVIGAGVAGLIAARTLQDHGLQVSVFEKSRGPSGRAGTRRREIGFQFDHGAQYFTARDPQFVRQAEAWIEQGVVAEWSGRIVEIRDGTRPKEDQPRRLVGIPGMSSLGRHLAMDLKVKYESKVVGLSRLIGQWQLTDAAGTIHGPFDHLIVGLPAPQAAELLNDHPLAVETQSVPMTPCWAVLLAFDQPIENPWDGAFIHDSPLAWVARDSSKPSRDQSHDCWVLHASPEWSAAHIDSTQNDVASKLVNEFARLTSGRIPEPTFIDVHRWRYSATPLTCGRRVLYDSESAICVCGDWLAGGRIEGAYLSGTAAAGCVLRAIELDDPHRPTNLKRTSMV